MADSKKRFNIKVRTFNAKTSTDKLGETIRFYAFPRSDHCGRAIQSVL